MSLVSSRAVYVLWLREVKKFFRVKSRLFGTIATPLFFLVFLGFGLRSISIPGAPQSVDYITFLVPGIIGMGLLFSSFFSGITVISDRQFGFLKEIMVAPVSRVSIVLGRIAGGATVSVIQGLLLVLITTLVGFEFVGIMSLLLAFVFMVLIATTFISFGLIFASRMKDTQGFNLVANFFVFPMFFLSGALYPLNNLPAALRYLSYIDPLTYGIDGLRGALVSFSVFHPAFDFGMMLAFALFFIFLSSYMFKKSNVL